MPTQRTVTHEVIIRAWAKTRGLPLAAEEPIPDAIVRRFLREHRLL